jgi:HK97 family phage prohead protease
MGLEYASFGMELSQAEMQGRTLVGYASVFNYPIETVETWLYGTTTYIRNGAFGNTIQEHRDFIQPLFNHGHDPQIGEKPLGKISVMREDAHGLYVEVPLDETSYNDDLIVSLGSGALRAMSIGFMPERDSYSDDRAMREIIGPALRLPGRSPSPRTGPRRRRSTRSPPISRRRRELDDDVGRRRSRSRCDFDPRILRRWEPNRDGSPIRPTLRTTRYSRART